MPSSHTETTTSSHTTSSHTPTSSKRSSADLLFLDPELLKIISFYFNPDLYSAWNHEDFNDLIKYLRPSWTQDVMQQIWAAFLNNVATDKASENAWTTAKKLLRARKVNHIQESNKKKFPLDRLWFMELSLSSIASMNLSLTKKKFVFGLWSSVSVQ